MMDIASQWEEINAARRSPPVNVEAVASALGVKVKQAVLHPQISGMIEKDARGGYVITLNAGDSYTRRRFTLAHELGHYMLHRNQIGNGLDDDRAYRSTQVGKYHNTAIGPSEETEANKFAANLLMPYTLVQAERQKLADNVNEMAERFGVSPHAMSIRMGIPYQP